MISSAFFVLTSAWEWNKKPAYVCRKFAAFSASLHKNVKEAYFNQHLECKAPTHWSKYTTSRACTITKQKTMMLTRPNLQGTWCNQRSKKGSRLNCSANKNKGGTLHRKSVDPLPSPLPSFFAHFWSFCCSIFHAFLWCMCIAACFLPSDGFISLKSYFIGNNYDKNELYIISSPSCSPKNLALTI